MADQPTPPVIRQRAQDIVSQAQFNHSEGWLQRAMDWLGDQLNRFHFGVGTGPGFIGNLITVAFFALAAFLLYRLVRWLRPPSWRGQAPTGVVIESEPRRNVSDWRTEAEECEARGAWRDALLARYRELLGELIDHAVVADVAGRTTGEYRTELERAVPTAAGPFGEATDLFEEAWYGGAPTGPDENARFRELAQHVRAAALARVPA